MLDRTSAPVQSRDIATRFVETLTGKSNEVMRLRFIHDSDRCNRAAEREGMIAQLWPDIIAFQKQGYGVFYFVNEVEHGRGSGKGGCATDADVKDDCRVLGTDHDKGLPNIWHVQPPIVVYTSKVMLDGKEVQKGQALWPVYELPKAEFKPAQLRLAKYYGADKSISNPSRVLRLPGTLHLKNPANPQLVTFEKFTDDGADFFEYVTTGPELLAALPPELEGKSGRSSATGAAITFKHLRQLLSYLDPNAPRDE